MSQGPLLTVRDTVLSEYDRRQAEARADGFVHTHATRLKLPDCQRLILDITSADPITIIIDAIDEIDQQHRHEVVQLLQRIASNSVNVVKVLITSRYDAQVMSLVEGERLIQIYENDNRMDLEAFVAHQLKGVVQQKRLLNGVLSAELKKRVQFALIDGAGEM